MKKPRIRTDCIYYKGDIPCIFHKKSGRTCMCNNFEKMGKRIVVIKIGALGDVIRTTPLIRGLKSKYRNCEIYWLTEHPEILPDQFCIPLKLNSRNILTLMGDKFDILINLDKEKIACSLANILSATKKYGFGLEKGRVAPINRLAMHKWLTGLDDKLNKANPKSYLEEIFEICNLKYAHQDYIINKSKAVVKLPKNWSRPIIGLNTGCGGRWPTRVWPDLNWMQLIKLIKKKKYTPILLGGLAEDKKNKRLAKITGAKYLGVLPLLKFVRIIEDCDIVVTSVSMAAQLCIGLNKKMVLFNNIFNDREFNLKKNQIIIQPNVSCLCCFKTHFDDACETVKCMQLIDPELVLKKIEMLLKK